MIRSRVNIGGYVSEFECDGDSKGLRMHNQDIEEQLPEAQSCWATRKSLGVQEAAGRAALAKRLSVAVWTSYSRMEAGPSRLNNRLWWILPYYVLLLIELKGLVYDHPSGVVIIVTGNQWLRQIRPNFPATTDEQVTPTDLRFCLLPILLSHGPLPCPSSSLQVLIDHRQYYLHTWTALLLHLLLLLITLTVLPAGSRSNRPEVYLVEYRNRIPLMLCCVHKMPSCIHAPH